jgi:hypothetical protein
MRPDSNRHPIDFQRENHILGVLSLERITYSL